MTWNGWQMKNDVLLLLKQFHIYFYIYIFIYIFIFIRYANGALVHRESLKNQKKNIFACSTWSVWKAVIFVYFAIKYYQLFQSNLMNCKVDETEFKCFFRYCLSQTFPSRFVADRIGEMQKEQIRTLKMISNWTKPLFSWFIYINISGF